jgi:hypothetical protein
MSQSRLTREKELEKTLAALVSMDLAEFGMTIENDLPPILFSPEYRKVLTTCKKLLKKNATTPRKFK